MNPEQSYLKQNSNNITIKNHIISRGISSNTGSAANTTFTSSITTSVIVRLSSAEGALLYHLVSGHRRKGCMRTCNIVSQNGRVKMLKIIIQYETTSVTLNSRSMTDNESRSLKFMN